MIVVTKCISAQPENGGQRVQLRADAQSQTDVTLHGPVTIDMTVPAGADVTFSQGGTYNLPVSQG